MRKIAATLLFALCVSAVVDISGRTNTVNADSCSASDVQAALNRAGEGDVINIPAGTCKWATRVTWTAPPDVILQGAGNFEVGGGDATIIVDDYADSQPILRINTNATGTFRISRITIRGGTGSRKVNSVVAIGGQSKQFRMDHMHFDMTTYAGPKNSRAIRFNGWINGVVDHSIFEAYQGIDIWYDGYRNGGGRPDGDGAWAEVTGLGSSDFLFIEDNEFRWISENGGANDCSHGGKWVFRHNRLSKTVQTHPTGGMGRARGCRAWEVYNNTFSRPNNSPVLNAFFASAGTGVVWGNEALSGYKHLLTMHAMRKDNRTYPATATPTGWGYCGTEFNGRGSNWDGNTNAWTGYPCLDQPGRGKGDLLAGGFPNVMNKATECSAGSPCAWPRQALEPVYEWGNRWNAVPNSVSSLLTSAEPGVLEANRDYYLQATPFTGRNGTGVGSLSERPTNCTTGVAYWASDRNTLYQCSATDRWTEYYRPYPYPHPLVGAPGMQLDAPRGLRIVTQ